MTFQQIISTEEDFRAIMGFPSEIVMKKELDYIDVHCRTFIEQSPFITIATADDKGNLDVSPKGDPAGFVKILDEKTLAIPDRPGNKRADTLLNIIKNPNIGLIFLIPGIKETLRVNGKAKIVTDVEVLQLLEHQGKKPTFAIIVEVKEAFMHCAKCIIRSELWTSENKAQVPSLAEVLVDHAKLDISKEELDAKIKEDQEIGLY